MFSQSNYDGPTNGFKNPNYNENYNLTAQAAKLGTYGHSDMKIDLYSGKPNINIPIYDTQIDGINLNISLNYDTSGVLVNQQASWVGQNWQLNAGGHITRIIRGASHDELDYSTPVIFPGYNNQFGDNWWGDDNRRRKMSGFFHQRSYIGLTGNDQHDLAKLIDKSNIHWPIRGGTVNPIDPYNYRDFEPDIFHFSFLGHSGFFFMDIDGNWNVHSDSNLKVEFDLNNDLVLPFTNMGFHNGTFPTYIGNRKWARKTIGRLTLKDDKGYTYIFGDNYLNNLELTIPNFFWQIASPAYASKWNLTKVVDPNGIEILNFNYETGHYKANMEMSFFRHASNAFSNSSNYYTPYQLPLTKYYQLPSSSFLKYNVAPYLRAEGSGVIPSYLTSITSNRIGLNIIFNRSVANTMNWANRYTTPNSQTYYGDHGNPFFDNQGNIFNFNFLHGYHITDYLHNETTPAGHSFPNPWNDMGIFGLRLEKLNSIIVKNVFNQDINNIIFNYDELPDIRLFLNKITNDNKAYKFEYNQGWALPKYLTTRKDPWGYFNNQDLGLLLPFGRELHTIFGDHPIFISSVSNNYLNKLPFLDLEQNKYSTNGTNASRVSWGTLNRIIWPTGGSTEFIFEPHSFQYKKNDFSASHNTLTSKQMGGGLRIKKIISDGIEKEFFYVFDQNEIFEPYSEQSSGILLFEPMYFLENKTVYYSITDPCSSCNNFTDININGVHLKRFNNFYNWASINPLNQKSNFFDGNVGYARVYEKSNEGYIQYDFTSYLDKPDLLPLYLFPEMNERETTKKIDRSIERGLLKQKKYYDNNFSLKKEELYEYDNQTLSKRFPEIKTFSGWLFDASPQKVTSSASFYDIIYNKRKVIKTITKEYYQSGIVEKENNYNYRNHKLFDHLQLASKDSDLWLSQHTFKIDNLNNYATTYKYPFDYTNQNLLTNKNILDTPLEIVNFKNNHVLFTQINELSKDANTSQLIKLKKTSEFKHNLTSAQSEVFYDLYDQKGNLLQYHNNNSKYTTFIFAYNQTLPVAKIENIAYASIPSSLITAIQTATDSPTSTETQVLTALNALRTSTDTNLQNAMITTYTYKPLIGISTVTDPKGDTQTYIYDDFNRLKEVRDKDNNILSENQYHYRTPN
jgi:YD repeat-containing protein